MLMSVFFFFNISHFVFSSNNTLWGSLKEPDIVNTNEFEDLFSKATLQQKKKPLSDTYEKKAKTKKVDSFILDGLEQLDFCFFCLFFLCFSLILVAVIPLVTF